MTQVLEHALHQEDERLFIVQIENACARHRTPP